MLSKLIGTSGEVVFDAVIDESVNEPSEVTDHPVEEGADVADHVKVKPETIPLNGVIAGDRAEEKLAQLQRFRHERELLTFIGVETFHQVVITNISRKRTAQISDGFELSLTLRKVRISKLKEVKISVPAKSVNKTQVKKKTSKGKQQPKKKTPKQPKAQSNFQSSRSGNIERLGL